jgi:chromosome segregation ATPase
MKLNGIPWGIVNYYWGNNDESDGYHILWQKGSELRRAFINRTTHPWKVHLDESIKYGEMDRQLALRKIQEILGDIIRYEERIKIELKNIEFLKNKLSALAIDLKHYQEKEDYLKKQIKDDEKQRLENIPKLQKIIDSIKDLPHLFIAV